MADGIYTALTGAVAQQQSLDVIANNVANVNTAGYRADRAAFSQFLAGAQRDPNAVSQLGQPGARVDHFVHVDAVAHDYTDGALKLTGNPLDMALSGDGFFAIDTPQGERFTRSGSFVMGAGGVLSTAEGYPVLGTDNKPIQLPSDRNVQVESDGTLKMDALVLGKLKLVRAPDPTQLEKESATCFKAAPNAQLESANATVTQGHIEASNVNAVAGLNDLIAVSRSFDALQKVIDSFQKIDERTARDLGSRNS
jgi:flagellar basal-body rod protein FlgF